MKKVLLLSLCFALASARLPGAEPAGELITFDRALEIMLAGNPSLEAARWAEESADLERKAAIGLRAPQIGVFGSYAHTDRDARVDMNDLKDPVKGAVNSVVTGLGQAGITLPPAFLEQMNGLVAQLMGANWGLTLQQKNVAFVGGSVSVPIYTGGKINAANRAARINLGTVRKQGEQSRNALVSELVQRYFGLALAQQVVVVRQQVVEGVRVHLQDAIALEAEGIIARSERLYAEVKMAEAERELTHARLQVQTLQSALASTLGCAGEFMPVSSMFVLTQVEPADHYRELAGVRNPLLGQVELKRELAEQGVKLRFSEYMPQVAAMGGGIFANYQLTRTVPRWVVGVGVNLKIFDGLSREHKYAAARRTVRQVEALEAQARSQIGVLVDQLYNQMRDYRDQIPSIEASISFAEEYLRIKNAAFHEGMASSADVIDAQLNLAKIRTERLQAAYNFDVALARLLEAAGASERFADYARSERAEPIRYDNEKTYSTL